MTEADLGELRSTVEKLLAAPGEATSCWARLASAGVATVGSPAVAAILGTALASRPEWSDYVLGSVGLRIGGGTEEVQKNVIADRIIRLPREPRKDADVPWSRLLRTTSHPITSRKASS